MSEDLGRREKIRELLKLANLFVGPQRDFLKELTVHENGQVLAISASVLSGQSNASVAFAALGPRIALRAAKSFEELYQTCPMEVAHNLAAIDIEGLAEGSDTRSLVYGEVDFDSFYEVLQTAADGLMSPRDRCGGEGSGGLTFYDLGSGTGRAIFVAALAIKLDRAVGIELLSRVHAASLRVLRRYKRLVEPVLREPPLIRLYNGSFLSAEYDWADGDLVFANSTCFEAELLHEIALKCQKMRPGTRVITFSAALPTPTFRVIYKRKLAMSWGGTTVYIQERLSAEETEAPH